MPVFHVFKIADSKSKKLKEIEKWDTLISHDILDPPLPDGYDLCVKYGFPIVKLEERK